MSYDRPMATETTTTKSMTDIVALCKRRGFVYPASEIYGGINGFWDYGPLGVELKNHLRDAWWHEMVRCPPFDDDGHPLSIVGLDSSIIQNPRAWEASGHVAGFNDPMVDCRETKSRYRADHLTIFGVERADTSERVGPYFAAVADFTTADDDELIDPHRKAIRQIIQKNDLEAVGHRLVRIADGIASDEVRQEGVDQEKRTRLIEAGAQLICADFTEQEQLLHYLSGR